MKEPQALSDRLFIRLEQPDTSLILTNNINHRNIGTIVSVGPLVKSVKTGDKVLFHIFDDLPTYDPDVVVIREKSLLGIFKQ